MTVTQANCLHCKLRVAKLHLTRTFMAKWWLSELRDEWIYHCLWQRRAGCQVNQTTTKNKWRMGAAGYYGQRRVQTLHCTKMVLNGRMIKHLLKLVDIFIDMLCWFSLKLQVQSCHSNSWVPRVLPGDSVFFFVLWQTLTEINASSVCNERVIDYTTWGSYCYVTIWN